MKQKLHFCKRGFALMLAVALVLTTFNVQLITANAAQTPDPNLAAPVGLVLDYTNGKIGVVWGDPNNYGSYCVTITGEDTEVAYEEEYLDQTMDHHDYECTSDGGYEAGKTYVVEVQGQKDGNYSLAASERITIPGGESGDGTTDPEVKAPIAPSGLVGGYWETDDINKGKIKVEWGAGVGDGGTPTQWIVSIDGKVVGTETRVAAYFYENIYTAGEHTISVVAENAAGKSPAGTITFTLTEEQAGVKGGAGEKPETSDEPINLEADKTTDSFSVGGDNGWGNSAATLTVDGTKAVIEASSFGSEGSEWQILYKIFDLGIDPSKTYKLEFDITSTVDKKVYVKLDDSAGLIDETISLEAGQPLHYSKEQKEGTFSAKPELVFGLGQFAGENVGPGTITIENVKLTEVTLTPEPDPVLPDENASALNFEILEHADYLDVEDGVNVDVKYKGTTATATGSNWGGAWGGDSKYQIQLKTLIPVTTGKEYNVSFKIKSEVVRSVFLKLGDVDVDGTDYYSGNIELDAGVEKTVTVRTNSAVAIEKLMFLVALGDQAPNTQNTITISDLMVYTDDLDYVEVLPYIDFSKLNHDADFLDGVDVDVKYDGTVITAEGKDWGADWDTASYWQIQLKEPIPVTVNDTYEFSFAVKSDVARSIFLKFGDLANEGTVFYEETIALNAGEEKVVSGKTTKPVDIEELMVLFALGDQLGGNTQNTITISKFLLKGENSGYVIVGGSDNTPTASGKEYDFSATEDNAANDYQDPGKTKDGYTLIWADEFDGNYGNANVDGNGLNLDNWAYQLGDGTTDCGNPGWGNNEYEAYTNRKKNVGVNEDLNGNGSGDGYLRITASREDGYTYESESPKNYTSARLRTTKPGQALFTTTYGYIEARMSLPETQGAWPAFWMLPESTDIYGGWPLSGELDIMETTGIQSNQACGTLHWGAPDHVYKGSGYTAVSSEIAYFHTYAVDWQPNTITWYYDGVPIYTANNWETGYADASDKISFDAPFDEPFYILLNLAVDSGAFGGTDNRANFDGDINMYVDYVRVYQKTEGYPAYAEKTVSDSAADDWAQYAGQNQIAGITAGSIEQTMGADADTDNSKWYVATNANGVGGAATAQTVEGSDGNTWAKINITDAGSMDYAVQLIGHYNAKGGYVYKVSFDAYADGSMVGKQVNSDSKEWAGWSANGIQSFTLQSTPSKVSYLFEQKEDFDKCRIEFNLGATGTGNVYIGNVKVEIVDPASIGAGADPDSRRVLSDGNVIYNGTFDQGSRHIGYWTALSGTKLEVPRYTTEKIGASDLSVVDVASKTNYEHIADGVKYYERRAQISAGSSVNPGIYQSGFKMVADNYNLSFDMYSAKDTMVTVAIYSTDKAGNLQEQIKAYSVSYKAADGVKNLSKKIEIEEDIPYAALVLQFDKGASVQVDNVKMIGLSQGEQADPEPVTGDTEWSADNGGGTALPLLKNENGVYTLNNVTSGGNWYSPQIISQPFSLTAKKEYELTFKYKLEGASNNTFEYNVQERSSWHEFIKHTSVTYVADEADEDGFCTYTVRFTADISHNNVAIGFGLGSSEANNAAFSFKDVTLTLIEAGGDDGDDTENPWDDVDPSDDRGQVDVRPDTNLTVTLPDAETIKNAVLSIADKASVLLGTDIDIIVTVKNIQNPPEDDVAVVNAAKGSMILGCYLDISIAKQIGESLEQVTETNTELTFVIGIPDSLRKAGRTFSVIRVHDGEATVLADKDTNPNTITFSTDKFSTYALVYRDGTTGNTDDTNNAGNVVNTSAPGTAQSGNNTSGTTVGAEVIAVGAPKTADSFSPMTSVAVIITGVVCIVFGYRKKYLMEKGSKKDSEQE